MMDVCQKLEALGFTVFNNGGGCELYRKDTDECSIVVTDLGGAYLPRDGEEMLIALYDDFDKDEFPVHEVKIYASEVELGLKMVGAA